MNKLLNAKNIIDTITRVFFVSIYLVIVSGFIINDYSPDFFPNLFQPLGINFSHLTTIFCLSSMTIFIVLYSLCSILDYVPSVNYLTIKNRRKQNEKN